MSGSTHSFIYLRYRTYVKFDKKHILLVDDEELFATFEKYELEQCGYQVSYVKTGEEAILKTMGPGSTVELILMDIDLGDSIDGTVAATAILLKKEIPIVFHSSHTEKEIVEKTEKITCYGYVVKNTGITVLNASIKMAFRLFESKKREMQKEHALCISEQRLLRALEGSNEGLWEYNIQTQELFHSKQAAEMLGYTQEELTLKGGNVWDYYHPDDIQRVKDEFWQYTAHQKDQFDTVARIKARDGSYRWLRSRGKTIPTHNGTSFLLSGLVSDETEKITIAHQLALSERKYHTLFTNTDNAIAVFSAIDNGSNFIITDLNPAAENISSLEPSTAVGKAITIVFPDCHKNGLFETIKKAWRTGESDHFCIKASKNKTATEEFAGHVFSLSKDEVVTICRNRKVRKPFQFRF